MDNVHTSLSLVGYEADLRKAMEYVFGSTLVCDTLDNAKRVAFDKQVMTKTVTLGGDIFDPQGTLSGGESHLNVTRNLTLNPGCCCCFMLALKIACKVIDCVLAFKVPAPSRCQFWQVCRR